MSDCESCNGACCRMDWEIIFDADEPVPRNLSFDGSRMVGGCLPGERMMKKRDDKSCIALVGGKCSIYERRPSICRDVDVGSPACLASISLVAEGRTDIDSVLG